MELEGGWRVVEKLEPGPDATGGFFSVSYVVERDGQRAFLKALDYSRAFQSGEVARDLQNMTAAFTFEVDVLEWCGVSGMSRVVRALASGQVEVPGEPNSFRAVSYLIFELADGDIRSTLDQARAFDLPWALRMIHNVANALQQLHGGGIAHQDLKPSNVLTFDRDSAKIADLGCAARRGATAPRDAEAVAGALSYAPPELLYGQVAVEWNERRQACDLYHLGSFVVFMFGRVTPTGAILAYLPPEHRPAAIGGAWQGTYSEVLPFVRDAFDQVMADFAASLEQPLRDEIVSRVMQLCEPDPARRGHPRNRAFRHANPFTVDRYVTEFDLLAQRARAGFYRSAA